MNLRDIDPESFLPIGPNKKSLLVERVGQDEFGPRVGSIIIPSEYAGEHMSSGLEPPVLTHYLSQKCKVLAVGPNVRGVSVGDLVNVPGHGNVYADAEDGNRLIIREGDIAFKYDT